MGVAIEGALQGYPSVAFSLCDHSLQADFTPLKPYLVPVIRWIDDRQEGREKPVLYITLDAMRDGYGKVRSNMHKTFEKLIETYDVYFVVTAPTNDHDFITQSQEWIEDAISAPAYNRVIMTNKSSLLLGDFIISTDDEKAFMGTCIQLGSPDFKCWEDIETYFSRIRN